MLSGGVGYQRPHPDDEQGAQQEDESPRIQCLLGLHLLHGMLRWSSRPGDVVVHQAHRHIWGCAFSVERLHVKESLRPDNARTTVH